MLQQLLAIIRNTFFESIRQPIMLVVLLVATLLIMLSNPLSAFTMEDDQRMLVHMGLATVFAGGALLASFIATSVLSREIENRTALTVISKPVGRPLFVAGKFLGVAGAMTVATLLMGFSFLLVEQHGVLQTVRDPYHWPVLTFGLAAGVLGVGAGIWCNYFYGMAFSSTVICVLTPLAGLAYFLSLLFRPDFTPQPPHIGPRVDLWLALACLLMAILVLTAVAIAASTRLGQVMTLCVTLGVFLLGMLSDHFLGEPIHRMEQRWQERAAAAGLTHTEKVTRVIHLTKGGTQEVEEEVVVATVPLNRMAEGGERAMYWAAWVGYAAVPNFQRLWLADAITQRHVIPRRYVWQALLYAALDIVAILGLAVILFQRREVG
jgi:ABC-type transport system involved in multi-copper enzyme maturation permease subunit